ncbi:D-alanyl-D-alanine carboxypeptidase family protein [Aureimonas pseudogalii]
MGLTAWLVAASTGHGFAQEAKSPFAIETSARQVFMIDADTGSVLYEKEADTPFPPASLAKLMTIEVVLDALATGEITSETPYPVTNHAWRTGGAPSRTSTMFAAVRSSVPVDALVRGVVIQAANDGAIVLAEGLAGSEEAFAARMNERAKALGLTNSHFVNPTGLPAEGANVSVRDMATLARHFATTYSDAYRLYREPQFEWNKILQRNRNPLLGRDIGATGMALGFTEGLGYSIVGVTERDGRRTVLAAAGFETDTARTTEAVRLLAWAETSFERRTLFTADTPIGTAQVFGGIASTLPVVLGGDLVATVPVDPSVLGAALVYDGPLRAPVAKGDRIGRLDILIDGKPSISRPLLAGKAVAEGTFSSRALDAAHELAFGWIRNL